MNNDPASAIPSKPFTPGTPHPTSQLDISLERQIPAHVNDAVRVIENYFAVHHPDREWELSNIASRDFVHNLRREVEDQRKAIAAFIDSTATLQQTIETQREAIVALGKKLNPQLHDQEQSPLRQRHDQEQRAMDRNEIERLLAANLKLTKEHNALINEKLALHKNAQDWQNLSVLKSDDILRLCEDVSRLNHDINRLGQAIMRNETLTTGFDIDGLIAAVGSLHRNQATEEGLDKVSNMMMRLTNEKVVLTKERDEALDQCAELHKKLKVSEANCKFFQDDRNRMIEDLQWVHDLTAGECDKAGVLEGERIGKGATNYCNWLKEQVHLLNGRDQGWQQMNAELQKKCDHFAHSTKLLHDAQQNREIESKEQKEKIRIAYNQICEVVQNWMGGKFGENVAERLQQYFSGVANTAATAMGSELGKAYVQSLKEQHLQKVVNDGIEEIAKLRDQVKDLTKQLDGALYSPQGDILDILRCGREFWQRIAKELAEAWWWCSNNNAQLQHGDLDKDPTFSVVLLGPSGVCAHDQTPMGAVTKAKQLVKAGIAAHTIPLSQVVNQLQEHLADAIKERSDALAANQSLRDNITFLREKAERMAAAIHHGEMLDRSEALNEYRQFFKPLTVPILLTPEDWVKAGLTPPSIFKLMSKEGPTPQEFVNAGMMPPVVSMMHAPKTFPEGMGDTLEHPSCKCAWGIKCPVHGGPPQPNQKL